MKKFLIASKGFFREKVEGIETLSSSVTGHIVDIVYKKTMHGDIINLHVLDAENFYIVSFFANSRCAHAFYMLIKNVDLHTSVTFKLKMVEGLDVFYVVQNNESIRWFYGLDTGNKLPYNPAQRLVFLKEMVVNEVLPILKNKLNPYPSHPVYKPFVKPTYYDRYKDYTTKTSVKSHIGANNEVDEC